MKIYGPYTRPDGRKIVVIKRDDGTKTSKSYPKYLMESHLGRELGPDETVDHVNRDFRDDEIDNLKVLDRPLHSELDALRVKMVEIECVLCGTKAMKQGKHLDANERQGKAGPFCGHSCAAIYAHKVRQGEIEPIVRTSYQGKREYYRRDKPR